MKIIDLFLVALVQTAAMEVTKSLDNVQIIARRKECKHFKRCRSACMM